MSNKTLRHHCAPNGRRYRERRGRPVLRKGEVDVDSQEEID